MHFDGPQAEKLFPSINAMMEGVSSLCVILHDVVHDVTAEKALTTIVDIATSVKDVLKHHATLKKAEASRETDPEIAHMRLQNLKNRLYLERDTLEHEKSLLAWKKKEFERRKAQSVRRPSAPAEMKKGAHPMQKPQPIKAEEKPLTHKIEGLQELKEKLEKSEATPPATPQPQVQAQ